MIDYYEFNEDSSFDENNTVNENYEDMIHAALVANDFQFIIDRFGQDVLDSIFEEHE